VNILNQLLSGSYLSSHINLNMLLLRLF